MKRFFLMLVSLAALGLVVGGCGKKEEAKKDDKAATKPSEAKPADTKPADTKPADEGAKPADEGAKPADEGAKPADEGAKPAEGAAGDASADGTGIEACDKYLKRLATCDKMPPEAKQGLQQSFQAWKTAREQANKAGGDTLKQWEDQMKKTCEQASQGWEATLKAQGC